MATHYFVQIEARVVDPGTNASFPIAEISCNRQGPSLTGWVVKSVVISVYDEGQQSDSWTLYYRRTWFVQQLSTADIQLPNSPTYIMTVGVDVDDWKLAYEIAMAVMIFAASVVAFVATTIFVFLVWLRDKRLSVSDLLAMPLAVGATISALRAAFPPNTELEIFLGERKPLTYPAQLAEICLYQTKRYIVR